MSPRLAGWDDDSASRPDPDDLRHAVHHAERPDDSLHASGGHRPEARPGHKHVHVGRARGNDVARVSGRGTGPAVGRDASGEAPQPKGRMHTPQNEPAGRPDPRSVDVRRGGRHDVPRAAIRRARRQGRDDPPRPVQRRTHIRDARVLRGYPEEPADALVPEFSLPGNVRVAQVLGVKHFDPPVLSDRVVDPARIAQESAGMTGGRRAELDSPEDAVSGEHEERHQKGRDRHDRRPLGHRRKQEARPTGRPQR